MAANMSNQLPIQCQGDAIELLYEDRVSKWVTCVHQYEGYWRLIYRATIKCLKTVRKEYARRDVMNMQKCEARRGRLLSTSTMHDVRCLAETREAAD